MKTISQKAPKRRIERTFTRLEQTLGTSVTATIIHTAEDTKTLVRTLIQLTVFMSGDLATPIRGEIVLAVAPNGVTVVDEPNTVQSLDNNVPLQEIARFPLLATHNATGDYVQTQFIDLDIKAMRKLKEEDQLQIRAIAASASSIRLFGIIYQWFKE